MSIVHPEGVSDFPLTTASKPSGFTYADLEALKDRSRSYLLPLATIGLIDMNAFFAQVEQHRLGLSLDAPVVCAQWLSLIAVSYAARKYGINRMDTIKSAREKCPNVILGHAAVFKKGDDHWSYHPGLPNREHHKVSLDPYRRELRKIIRVVQGHCGMMEKASVDEFYVDMGQLVYETLLIHFPELLSGKPSDVLPKIPEELPAALQWKGIVFESFEEAKLNESRVHTTDNALATTPSTDSKIEPTDKLTEGKSRDAISAETTTKNIPRSDKAIVDWDDVCILIGSQIVYKIRKAIYDELGYTTSGGVASTKTVAKLAAGYRKPDNQTVIRSLLIHRFLENFELTDFTGMGGKGGDYVLTHFDIPPGNNSISYIRENISLSELQREVPDLAQKVYDIVRGNLRTNLTDRVDLKSMMSRKNFITRGQKFLNLQDIHDWIRVFAGDLLGRVIELDDETRLSGIIKRPRTLSVSIVTVNNSKHSRQMALTVQTSTEKLKDSIAANAFLLFKDLIEQTSNIKALNGGRDLSQLFNEKTPLRAIKLILIINMGVTISNFAKMSSTGMIDTYGAKTDVKDEIGRMFSSQERRDNEALQSKPNPVDNSKETPKELSHEDKEHIRRMFAEYEKTNGEQISKKRPESKTPEKIPASPKVTQALLGNDNTQSLIHEAFLKFHSEAPKQKVKENRKRNAGDKGVDIINSLKKKPKQIFDELAETGFCSICKVPVEDPIEHNDFHVAMELSKKMNG